MNDLVARLLNPGGRASVDAELAVLLRAGHFAGAEQVLTGALSTLAGPVATACLATSAESVEVSGWDELNADLVRLGRRGHVITAVGLDLSNYNDAASDDWWDKEPCVEVAAYTDSVFPFSTSGVEDLLRAGETYAAPWTGCMIGEEDAFPTVVGLRRVNGALLRHEEGHGRLLDTTADAAAHLGWWWQHLRFRQAVVRHLDAHGLALAVPVLAGSHGVGQWLVTVHRVDKVADHEATTATLLDARRRFHLENYERATQETVEELNYLRDNCRASWGFRNRDKRKTFIAYADARLALMCEVVGLPKQRGSIARMSDQYFADLVAAYVAWRRERARQTRQA